MNQISIRNLVSRTCYSQGEKKLFVYDFLKASELVIHGCKGICLILWKSRKMKKKHLLKKIKLKGQAIYNRY